MSQVYYTVQSRDRLPSDDRWLTENERRHLADLGFAKRRNDWVLGRWTAKTALMRFARQSDFNISRWEIKTAPDGAPLPFLDGRPCELGLSLSHSNGHAFCAVAHDVRALGCDLELVEPRSESFVDTFFTDSECELVESANPEKRDSLITMIWSAKESALKALRKGLTVDTRFVRVVPLIEPTADEWGTAQLIASESGVFSCRWKTHGPWVLTIAARGPIESPLSLEPRVRAA